MPFIFVRSCQASRYRESRPTLLNHSFLVTGVRVQWENGEQSWETRTACRQMFPKKTADLILYQRTGMQEVRYRLMEGLPSVEH